MICCRFGFENIDVPLLNTHALTLELGLHLALPVRHHALTLLNPLVLQALLALRAGRLGALERRLKLLGLVGKRTFKLGLFSLLDFAQAGREGR